MLALVSLTSAETAALEFGDPVEPSRTTEEWLRDVLADYDRRRPDLRETRRADLIVVLDRLLREEPDDSPILVLLIQAAGFIGSPELNRAVQARFSHADPGVKRAVIETLGRIGSWSTADTIRTHLKSPDPAIRRAAIVAMGGVGRAKDISNIRSAAGDALETPARESAARIRAVANEEFEAYVDVLLKSEDCEALFPILVLFWQKIVAAAMDLSRSESERGNAVRLISHGCLRPAGPVLLWVLTRGEEESPELRVEAAAGLGRCRLRQATAPLIELLSSGETRLVDAAIDSLGKLGMPEALEPLLALWDGADAARRERLVAAIRRLAAVDGSRVLADTLLPDPDAWHEPDAATPGDRVIFLENEASNPLIRGYDRALVRRKLEASDPETRRDAALIAAFFGRHEDAEMLTEFSRRESDGRVRALMERAADRLRRSASAAAG